MAGPVAPRASRRSPYSGTPMASLRPMAVLVLALTVGGCAVSGQMGSLFSSRPSADSPSAYSADPAATGSVGSARASAPVAASPPEADLVFARAAIVDVLTRGGRETSAPWENPHSGARGTVTPIATAYAEGEATCHGFLASYVRERSETWLQGEACREKKGKWEVKSLRPWKRS
jgi:surface antigen